MQKPVNAETISTPMLAALIDHVETVGCYDAQGERLSDQVPVVKQARMVLGDEAWQRVIRTNTFAPR